MNANCLSAFRRTLFLCRIYRLFLAVALVCSFLHGSFSQQIGAYKTIFSGDFPDISIWVVWDGFNWNPATVKPNQTNDIYVDQTHTLRLIGNEAVKNVYINAQTGAGQKLNLNGFELEVYGSLNAFSGAAPGIQSGSWNSQNWIGNSLTSRLVFRGNSRTIIPSGAWSGFSTNSRYSVIFDPGDGVELIIEEPFKALSFTVKSGTVIQKLDTTVFPAACPTFSFNNETTVYGTGPFGEFIIESGATFLTDCNSDILFRSGTISALNFDLQNGGTLILEGSNPEIEAANFQLNGRVIFRAGTSPKTYLSSTFVDASTPSAVRDLELQGSQNLTLPTSLTLLGNLEKSGTGNFLASGTNLTVFGSSDQEIIGFPLEVRDLTVNKAAGVFYPNADLSILRNLIQVQGTLDLEGNDLRINTGLLGSLNFNEGSWRNIGQFTYFGIPANLDGSNSTFPFEDTRNGGIRKVQLLGNSIGGSLSVNFTEYLGAEYNSGFIDTDGTTILYRLFSYFNFSNFSPSSNPVELRISADDLIVDNVDDLRIVGTGYAAPGAHLQGLDPVELWARRTLTFDELAGVNFTVGSFRTLSILPVTWLELISRSTSRGNELKWRVAKEENNLLFEVYRSERPTVSEADWKKIGVINSLGDTDLTREYQYLDTAAHRFKDYYYKIKQVDFSGRGSWSGVTRVAFPKEILPQEELILYPNPYASGELSLILPPSIDAKAAELIIQDSQGMTIVQANLSAIHVAEVVSGLAPGLYLVRVNSDEKVVTGKLIRQ
ncbi:T9SS type A sorting domain-containing protein [Algoriphagus litoralis]|uniref:T9SS type A sorting domain-containing protein n=1 Tax=Algoriphagus litoralis TaxID=2202829 RepID=UPI000DB95BE3|nr:T9SS type A sorting domain-containing protein [Algoriphagus litoralis]